MVHGVYLLAMAIQCADKETNGLMNVALSLRMHYVYFKERAGHIVP